MKFITNKEREEWKTFLLRVADTGELQYLISRADDYIEALRERTTDTLQGPQVEFYRSYEAPEAK